MPENNKANKRPIAKRSWTWKFFLEKSELVSNCVICGEDVAYNRTTSSMISHLNHVHKILRNGEYEKSGSNGFMTDSSSEFSENESDNSSENEKLTKRKRSLIEKCIVSFIVKTCQPLSIVENQEFKDLMSEMNNRYHCPTRKTLTSSIIPNEVIKK